MRPPRFPLLAVLTFVASLAAPSAQAGTDLRDLQGAPRQLDEFLGKGKWTVVMFWASDCRVCNQEAPAWSLFDSKHGNADARVVGVSLDGQARLPQARGFVERHLLDFPNLIGEPEQVARLFTEAGRSPWLGTPSFLVYSPAGELKARQIGALPPERLEQYIRKQAP